MGAVTENFVDPEQMSFLPLPSYTREDGTLDLAVIRKQLFRLEQEEFADLLCISPATYRAWEYEHRNPSGPSLSLLRIAMKRPDVVREVLGASAGSVAAKPRRARAPTKRVI